MIGLVTAEARAQMEKGRRKREREERARMPGSDAHAAAEGAIGHVPDEGEDCIPVDELPGLGKAYEGVGIHEGPGDPVQPGQINPADFQRPYVDAGHGALSPSSGPPNTPHIDLRGDRGQVRPVNPLAPTMPVEGPR